MGDIHTTVLPSANDIVASGQFEDPVRYFRLIQDILDKAATDPALVAKYARHLDTCPACKRVIVCRAGLELILPARALDWLKDHYAGRPDPLDVLEGTMRRKTTEELAEIVDEGGGDNPGKWYAAAEKILAERVTS